MTRAAILLLPAALAGCAEGSRLDGVDVIEASITDVSLFRVGAVVGVETGEATLEVATAEGEMLEVPVSLTGPRLGLMLDLAGGWGFIDLPLLWVVDGIQEPDDNLIPGTDLLGTYQGAEYSAVALVGVHYMTVTNEAGVWMPLSTLELGVAGSANYLWLTVAEKPEE